MKIPNQIFFDPCPAFISWLKEYSKGRCVFDAGAGTGRLGSLLKNAGISSLSFDTTERDSAEIEVYKIDATKMEYQDGGLVILARPCHGEWIEKTIERACESGCEVLYIGLEHNCEFDLSGVNPDFKKEVLIIEETGRDKEIVISFKDSSWIAPDPIKWFLIKFSLTGIWWVADKGDEYWYWRGGPSKCPKSKTDKILDITFAVEYQDLDHTRTSIMKPDSDTGWIDLQGNWYPCEYTGHDDYSFYVLKRNSIDIEEEGWIKVWGKSSPYGTEWTCRANRLTKRQKKKMVDLELSFNDGDMPLDF